MAADAGDAEHPGSLSILNPARKSLSGPELLHQLVSKDTDGAVNAVEFWTAADEIQKLSYCSLDHLSSLLANKIFDAISSTSQSRQDIIIPVLIPQSLELYVAWLAVLKSGAAFCPLMLDTPQERIKFICQDTSAILVLTTVGEKQRIAQLLPGTEVLGFSALMLENPKLVPLTSEEHPQTSVSLNSECLAYIQYTSGSTGLPKGVKVTHKAVTQALLAHDERLPCFKRFLQFASPTFDVSIFETFFPFFRGATLVSRNRECMLADLPGTIRGLNVDAAELTPTVAGTLLKSRQAAPCLRLLLTIGEMLTRKVIEEFGHSTAEPGILYGLYGPTEASIHCTIAPRMEMDSSVHNIGKPLPTVTAFIIDASSATHITVLPKGCIGELAVAGQLASGYLNRPDETNTAFVNLPGHGPIYRTGDRARIDLHGDIEMLGRVSAGQVKLRGQRIELGEIEQVACGTLGIETAVAAVINETLVLFCLHEGEKTTVDDVREVCKLRLPRFMIPGKIKILGQLPHLPSGKIDRRKLETQYIEEDRQDEDEPNSFSDQREIEIAKCICEELGCQLSRSSSLWLSGLDSLRAIKIASLLRERGYHVTTNDLLEVDNVPELASRAQSVSTKFHSNSVVLVEDSERWHETVTLARIDVQPCCEIDEIQSITPCSAIQVAMLAETLANASLNFNRIRLELAAGTTMQDVRAALSALAQKNEILRSGFIQTPDAAVPFVQVIWRQLSLDKFISLLHPLAVEASSEENQIDIHIHHTLYDGWSFDLILSDLNGLIMGLAAPDRPQYLSVSREQRRGALARGSTTEEYWRDRLLDIPPASLPLFNSVSPSNNGHQQLLKPLEGSRRVLEDISRKLRVSRQSVVAASVALLLRSYIGSPDVVFGSVASGRTIPVSGIEKIIGPCITMLPVRLDLSSVSTVRDLIMYTHRMQMDHIIFGDISLHEIKQISGLRTEERLFDVLIVWQESLPHVLKPPQQVKVLKTSDSLDYAMLIEVEPSKDDLMFKLTYDEQKVPHEQAQLFISQIWHLLDVFSTNDTITLDDVWNGCSDDILAIANAKFQPFAENFSLFSTIERLAYEQPDCVALEFVKVFDPEGGKISVEKLSYGNLWLRGKQIATVLRASGVQPDDIICVLMEKSIDMYLIILAIIIAGCGFLNIDIRTPSTRISRILQESKCNLILCDDGRILEPDITKPLTTMAACQLQFQAAKETGEVGVLTVDDSRLAYAVMTSGTTGIPKAIMLTRRNLLSNIDILSKKYPFHTGKGQLLQACSPAFDVFVFEVFWTWHRGMCLVSARNDILFRDITAFIQDRKITHLSLTPSVAALIDPRDLPEVKLMVTAGEPMNSKTFDKWADRGLFQGYGPAETTNICSVKSLVSKSDVMTNVGPPFPNTSIFICATQTSPNSSSNDFQPLPRGAVGEIYIGGDQVCRGYIDDDLTARCFVETQYGRLYRSGDVGRLLTNGDLLILGRDDDQVKIRGQRVELGDINSALLKLDFVADAVTFLIHVHENPCLASFWCGPRKQGKMVDRISELVDTLEGSLPTYMVPDILVPVKSMPLTMQGKIDRRKLLEYHGNLDSDELQRYSRGAVALYSNDELSTREAMIASAASEVTTISLKTVGPHTSFFSLGLDSINSIRLSKRLRSSGFGQIDVSTILRHNSPRRLQKAIAAQERGSIKPARMKNPATVFDMSWRESIVAQFNTLGFKVENVLPCTTIQEAMLSQADSSNSVAYRNQLCLRLSVDVEQVRAAWKTVVQRNKILRTGFVLTPFTEFAYAQVVLENFDLPWDQNPADLVKPLTYLGGLSLPPYRLSCSKLVDEGCAILTLEIHHALYDGDAMTILLKEAEKIIHSKDLVAPVPMERYLEYKLGLDMDESDQFWRTQLQSHDAQFLTAALSEGNGKDKPQRTSFAVTLKSSTSTRKLTAAAKKQSTTMGALVQATWARLLSRYSGSRDVCFGNVYSGRNLPFEGADLVVGPVFNTLPVRVIIKSGQTLQDLASQLHETNSKILPYQPSSLRRIIRNTGLKGRQLFDSLVLFQQYQDPLDTGIWNLVEDAGQMRFPGFILEILPDSDIDQVKFRLHIEGVKISPSSAEKILQNFDELLKEAVQYPQAQALSTLSIETSLRPVREKSIIKASSQGHSRLDNLVESLTSLEEHIRRLFSEFSMIHTSKIFKNTTIYDLGLDSISTVQIAFQLRKSGHEITGADVLEARTLSGLAKFCTTQKSGTSTEIAPIDLKAFEDEHRHPVCAHLGIKNECVEAVRPCTPTQSGILAQFINSKGAVYFNCLTLKLDQDVDLIRLKKAWVIVMGRHEMLRTGFLRLDTFRYAFGMITFQKGVRKLPWIEECSENMEETDKWAKDVLATLHEPGWRVLLQEQSTGHLLQVHILHALFDAQSLDRILADVATIYRGEELASTVPINPALVMMTSKSHVTNEDTQNFWSRMGNEIQASKFPDLKISHSVRPAFSTFTRKISLSDTEAGEACKQLGVSLQAVCQVAWARLLSEYTGESNVCFGVILSGRTSEETAHIVFPTISTVPFSIKIGKGTKDMLDETTNLNVKLNKYQFTPMYSMRKWLRVEGNLFDSVLVLQKYNSDHQGSRPWQVVDDYATAEYAVSVEILPRRDDSIDLRITSRSDVVPPQQAKMILQQYDFLLTETLKVEDETPLPTEILSSLPAKNPRIPTGVRLLHEFVQDTALRTPDKIALEFASNISAEVVKSSWTYKQLNEEGNKIAHLLLANKAKTGDLIAIVFDKCPQASFAILGILKAGCAYVPIDPAAPKTRTSTILEDADCKLLLTTKDKVSTLQGNERVDVLAADDTETMVAMPFTRPELVTPSKPQDTCYCLYTSGTTGVPKGCLISHDSAVQAMLSFERIFQGHWDVESRWLQFASFHFDVSVLEQYWSWSVGICVTSAPRDLLFEDLVGAINALQITHLDLTPSLARLLTPDQVPSLCRGVFIVGGEQVRQDILEIWGDMGCLYNFYGPSEVTIGCTVNQRVSKKAKASNIGQQWDNVGTFVLRPGTKQPVLRGAIGELCLSGPLVGKGYLNRLELTAEKFIYLQDNTRVYRSGDLVRLLHDNSFEFVGRMDSQLKLRGQRLEVAEVNHVVSQASDSIEDVCTMVLKHSQLAKEQLVTFFSRKSELSLTQPKVVTGSEANNVIAQIRRHAVECLPPYMVPTYILLVAPRIPLSTNNKGDAKALKALFESLLVQDLQNLNRSEHDQASEVKTRSVAKVILVLSSFLDVPASDILPSSRIFEAGLDSVSAIGFASSLRKAGFDGADSATIMRWPVISDLAYALETQDSLMHEKAVTHANAHIDAFRSNHKTFLGDTDVLADFWPCTDLQKDMLAKSDHKDGIRCYLSAFHYTLDPFVDLKKLETAWSRVQDRFAILRTIFVKFSEKQFGQVVKSHTVSRVKHFSDRSLSADVKSVLLARTRQWFEDVNVFSETPCWEVHITENKDGPNHMSLFIFHGLYDAISLPFILDAVARDLLDLPDQPFGPEFHEVLPHGPLSFREDAESFWMENLKEAVLLNLPVAPYSSPPSITTTSRREDLLPNNLLDLTNELEVTEAAIFHAAWLMVLSSRYGKFPALGMVVSGRNFPLDGADRVVGPLLATLPCQVTPDSGWSGADLVRACHSFNVDSKSFEHTSLRDIWNWVGLDVGEALFDSLFVFQKQTRQANDYKELWTEVGQETVPDYPLAIEIEHRIDGVFNTTVVGDPEFLTHTEANFLCEDLVKTVSQLSNIPHDVLNHGNRPPVKTDPELNRQVEIPVNRDIQEKIRSQVAIIAQQDPETVSDDTSIFQLGLDSVDAIRLSTALKSEGISLTVNIIMRLSSVEHMARYASKPDLGSDKSHKSASNMEEMQAKLFGTLSKQGVKMDAVEKVLPATPMQEGMLASFEKYYHFAVLEMRDDADETRLISAWNTALKIHPILRAKFVEVEDPSLPFVFAQMIMKPFDLQPEKISVEHESDLPNIISAKEAKVAQLGLMHSSVTLSSITASSSGKKHLLLGASHAIYDGWSIKALHQDVSRLYHDQVVSRPPLEPYLEYLLNQPMDVAAGFWERQLASFSPTGFPRIDGTHSMPLNVHRIMLESKFSSELLRNFCRNHNVTMQSLGLFCVTTVLSKYARKRDVSVGLVSSGRTSKDEEELMFPTFNTVAFRPNFKGGSRLELLRHIHRLGIEISEHQNFPLREAKKLHGQGGELFDTLFVMQRTPDSHGILPKLYDEVNLGHSSLDYPVNIELNVSMNAVWTAATSATLLSEEESTRLLENVETVLKLLIEDPNGLALTHSQLEDEHNEQKRVLDNQEIRPKQLSRTADEQPQKFQTAICEVLALVAQCDLTEISADTNLFTLGLDSISTIKVSSLLKRTKSVSLPVSVILRALTVERMAAEAKWVDEAERKSHAAKFPADDLDPELKARLGELGIPAAAVEVVHPASAGQAFMLDSVRMSQGRTFYPVFRYRASGVINARAIQIRESLLKLFTILRTAFFDLNGQTLQAVLKANIVENSQTGWQLTIRHEEEAVLVSLRIHHALYDAVSLPMIVSAVERICNGEFLESQSSAVVLSQFLDFTMSPKIDAQKQEFWTSYLSDTKQTPYLSRGTFSAPRVEIIDPSFLPNIVPLSTSARAAAVSIQALFYAAVAEVYAQRLGTLAVTIGVWLANRGLNIDGLEDLAYPTVNVVPLRVELAVELNLTEVARRIQRDLEVIQRAENCGVSLREIWTWTRVRVDCFVNFVRVPEGGEESNTRLVPAPLGRDEQVDEELRSLSSVYLGEQPEGEMPWCVPSVDVEAKLNAGVDGGLTVGVFAPGDMMGEEEVRDVLRRLREGLLRVCD